MKLLWVLIGLLIWQHQKSVTLKQLNPASQISDVEIGKTICLRDGEVFWGSEAKGDPLSVRLRTSCPDGKAIGVYHTHPEGTSKPSSQDISETLRAKLPFLCVLGEEALSCYKIK